MSELATAFIRIRPEMSGFKSETEAGVRSAFSGLGKLLAGTLVLGEGFKFGKDLISDAAQVQKSVEVIKAEFGAAGDEVAKFGEKGAVALGIAPHLADATSARFGILFNNLGIGQGQAAKMTLGFEKLAGSIAAIRGIDPATVLQNLPLAAAGNVRSLKQLGIAIDQNQLKFIAFRLGLTQTIGQALTPAQRAIAIYTVATQNLGQYQDQAKAHAGDLINVQRRLSAEWDKAKEQLGTALLPEISKLAGYLADHLPGAIDKLKSDFKTFRSDLKEITGPIGGVKGAVEGLLAAFAVSKIVAFAGAIRSDLIARGFVELKIATQAEKDAYIAAFGEMEIATIGLSATIKSALISIEFGALAIAAGFAAEYVINHWSQVKQVLSTIATGLTRIFRGTWEAIKQGGKAAAYYLLEYFTIAIRGVLELASHLPFVGKYAKAGLDAIQATIDKFKPDWSKVSDAFAAGGDQGGQSFGAHFSAAAQAALDAWANGPAKQSLAQFAKAGFSSDLLTGDTITKTGDVVTPAVAKAQDQVDKLKGTLNGLTSANSAAVTTAQASITNLQQSLAAAIQQENRDITDAVNQAKTNLQSIMSTLSGDIGSIIDAPLNKLQDRLSLQQNQLTLEQLRRSVLLPGGKSLSNDPQKALAQLKALANSANAVSRPAIQGFLLQYQQAALGVQQAQATITKRNIDVGLGNLASQLKNGKITYAEFKKRLLGTLQKDGASYKTAGQALGSAFADGFRGQVQGLLLQAAAIKEGPQRAGSGDIPAITRPLLTLQQDARDIGKQQRDLTAKTNALALRQAKAAEKSALILEQIKAADKIIHPQKAKDKQTKPTSDGTRVLNGATGP